MIIRTREDAIAFRKQIEAAGFCLDDNNASVSPDIYSDMNYDGSLIKVGTRINHDGALYKAAVDLWNTETNNPENAPTLWEKLLYHNGVRVIPETITVTTAFSQGENGYWEKDGKIYKSLVNNNVYTPEQYAPNWEVVDDEH